MTTQELKKQYSLQQWASLVQECRASGLPVKQWCDKNGILQGSYYYWLKKMRSKAIESLPTSTSEYDTKISSQTSTVFTKISLPQNSNHADLTVSLNGIEIKLNNGASTELIHTVLSLVKQLC